MIVKTRKLHDAMFRCTEGYVQLIVNSLEFELGRSFSAEEAQAVYHHVEVLIEVSCCFDTAPVGQPERVHNTAVPRKSQVMPSNLRERINDRIGILFSDDDEQKIWNACQGAEMDHNKPSS